MSTPTREDTDRELAKVYELLDAALVRQISLTEVLEGMIEYFPEGHSDGECFSIEKANLALGRSNECIHDWFPDYCLKCGIVKP